MVVQRFETDVRFTCPVCSKEVSTSVEVPEPNWGASEKMSELSSEDQTEVLCPNCGSSFSAYVVNSASSCDVTLDDYPDTVVVADMAFFSAPDEGDWSDYKVPEDPLGIYMDSYHAAGDLLAKLGGDSGSDLINRMVFSQQVSALEAYLGDTLINAVLNDKAAMSRLLLGDKDLGKERFSLADIAADPDLVAKRIRQYLKSVLYHNLGKVHFLYGCALGVEVLDPAADNSKIHKAILYRHDCVHRNGFDSDGKKLEVFTKQYVQEVADLMKALVEKIDTKTSPF